MVNLTRFLIYYRPQIYTYIISASRYLKPGCMMSVILVIWDHTKQNWRNKAMITAEA